MDIEIKVCKTDQVTEKEWIGFAESFNKTFEGESTAGSKKIFYSGNPFGYSYHAFAKDGDVIAGHTSLIPRWYNIGETQKMFGVSGGTFVCPDYRKDIFLFKKMYEKLKNQASNDDMAGTLGVPNENSFKYAVKILKKRHIGDLNFFALPINAGNVLKSSFSSVINPISKILTYTWYLVNRARFVIRNQKEDSTKNSLLLTDEFLKCRFKSKDYLRATIKGHELIYKIDIEDGVNTAYIMHISDEDNGLSLKGIVLSVGYIMKEEEVDLILYIGTINLYQQFLIRVPDSKKPKKLPLTIDILDKNIHSESIFDIDNWKFGLIDFDVR